MADRHEVFGPGDCDAVLPVNEITEEHTFGQFLTLAFQVEGRTRPLHLREGRPSSLGKAPASAQLMGDAVGLDAVMRTTQGDEPGHAVVTVDDEQLNRLLATGELFVAGKPSQVKLSSSSVLSLMRGLPTRMTTSAPSGPMVVQVVPPALNAKAPAVTRHQISDLSEFILNPSVPGTQGLPFRLTLKPETVGALRTEGIAQVLVGNQPLSLEYTHQARSDKVADPEASTSLLSSSVAMSVPEARPSPSRGGAYAALFLPWKQQWRLRGYSRGSLLHSLSLAPQEETTIEIFTWDRRKRSLEQESETDTEQSFESASVSRDTTDVVNELTNSGEFQVQADARVRVTYPAIQVEVGGQLSRREGVTQTAKRTSQHLTESTTKAATRVKTHRKTRITESMETGREQRVTRKVRNANQCHALNLNYFEIVANYEVVTTFARDDAAVCVLIDMPQQIRHIDFSDPKTCRIYERALATALLDRNLAAGFDAARLLASREAAKELVCDKVICPVDAAVKRTPIGPPLPVAEEVPEAVVRPFREIVRLARELKQAEYWPLMQAWDDGYERVPQATVNTFRRWLYWELLRRLLPALTDALDELSLSDEAPAASVDRLFNAIPGAGSMTQPGALDGPQYSADRDQIVGPVVDEYAPPGLERHWWWNALGSHGATRPDDHGLATGLEIFQSAYRGWQRAGLAPAAEEELEEAGERQQVDMDNDRLDYAYQLRELADARERLEALAAHLKLHESYYRYAILQAMPLGDQMQLLAGANAPLDLCEPRVIGMIHGTPQGAPDRLAVPLNLELLDESASSERPNLRQLRRFVDDILADLSAEPGSSRTINLPTSGVTVEPRLGACSACESFIVDLRAVELSERRAKVRAAEAANVLQEKEAARYDARLAAIPPELGDPVAHRDSVRIALDPLHVTVEPPRSSESR